MDMPIPPLYVPVDSIYGADELGLPFRNILAEGLVDATEGAVSQRSEGANMSVDVAAITKGAFIAGDDSPTLQPLYRARSTAKVNLAISANTSGSTRVDRIVARVYDSTFAGLANKWTIEVVEGTPGAGAPATPGNAISLATVSVANGASSIVNANITDTRTAYALAAALAAAQEYDVLTKITSAVTVVNTTTLTNILNYTIPGGTIGTDKVIYALLMGSALNDAGAAYAFQLKTILGGTTIHDTGAANYAGGVGIGIAFSSAQRAQWVIELWIAATGAANSQFVSGRITGRKETPTTGYGVKGANFDTSANGMGGNGFSGPGRTSVDLASAQALQVQIAPEAAHASLEWKLEEAIVAVMSG